MKFNNICIIDAKRSAIGRFMGTLAGADPADISAQVIRGGFDPALIAKLQEVILGNVYSTNLGQGIARKIAVNAGVPVETPAYAVNMVCGSGMQAVINGCMELCMGKDLVLAGGIEFMSNVPYAADGIRGGNKLGDLTLTDLLLKDGLTDTFSGLHMGITAENIAKKYGITREAQDAFSWEATQKAIAAVDGGRFKDEIVPVVIKDRKGKETVFDTDEHPNRTSTPEKIASLRPSFIKDGTGTVTAAGASGINDGVAFLLLGTEKFCRENDIEPLCTITAASTAGCDPQYMGLGPYYAVSALLEETGMDLWDVECLEMNEAFAAQALGCVKLLSEKYGVSEEQILSVTNLNGSGLGLGHPLGATGARIVVTLSHLLKNTSGKRGVASLCIGGGMGAAVMLERKAKE